MTPILETHHLSASYGPTRILHDISLSVSSGGVTVLLGANGAGKTTTLRAICNMMVRTTGEIWFQGQPIERKPTENIARLGIGHVPDGRGTFIHLTVEENLQLGAYMRRDRGRIGDDMAHIYGYFPRLKERRRQYSGTLSGGEQQMLAIGRALMLRPKLLLLDEPSFGLAPIVVREIFDILATIRRQDYVSILVVEQNASIALALADDCYLLETGRIIMKGPSASLANDDAVRRVYLGY